QYEYQRSDVPDADSGVADDRDLLLSSLAAAKSAPETTAQHDRQCAPWRHGGDGRWYPGPGGESRRRRRCRNPGGDRRQCAGARPEEHHLGRARQGPAGKSGKGITVLQVSIWTRALTLLVVLAGIIIALPNAFPASLRAKLPHFLPS